MKTINMEWGSVNMEPLNRSAFNLQGKVKIFEAVLSVILIEAYKEGDNEIWNVYDFPDDPVLTELLDNRCFRSLPAKIEGKYYYVFMYPEPRD